MATSQEDTTMFWVEAGIAVFAGFVAMLTVLSKRPNDNLGLLSDPSADT